MGIFSFSITLLFQHSYFSILPFHHFQHSFHLLSQSIIIPSKHSHFFPFSKHSFSFIYFLIKNIPFNFYFPYFFYFTFKIIFRPWSFIYFLWIHHLLLSQSRFVGPISLECV